MRSPLPSLLLGGLIVGRLLSCYDVVALNNGPIILNEADGSLIDSAREIVEDLNKQQEMLNKCVKADCPDCHLHFIGLKTASASLPSTLHLTMSVSHCQDFRDCPDLPISEISVSFNEKTKQIYECKSAEVTSRLQPTIRDANDDISVIQAWLQDQGLNTYGDPAGTIYLGGTPLYDEVSGMTQNLWEYLMKKFPSRPWRTGSSVSSSDGTVRGKEQQLGQP